jgi:hypothetical protein
MVEGAMGLGAPFWRANASAFGRPSILGILTASMAVILLWRLWGLISAAPDSPWGLDEEYWMQNAYFYNLYFLSHDFGSGDWQGLIGYDQPHLAGYVFGFALHAGGGKVIDSPGGLVEWDRSVDELYCRAPMRRLVEARNLQSDRRLLLFCEGLLAQLKSARKTALTWGDIAIGRRTAAVFAAASALLTAALCGIQLRRLLGGLFAGYVLVSNGVTIPTFQQAYSDSIGCFLSLLALICLVPLLAALGEALRAGERLRRSVRRLLPYAAAAGFFTGLAFSVKFSTANVAVAAAAAILASWAALSAKYRKSGGGLFSAAFAHAAALILVFSCAFATFVILDPFLWASPATGILHMVEYRMEYMEMQNRAQISPITSLKQRLYAVWDKGVLMGRWLNGPSARFAFALAFLFGAWKLAAKAASDAAAGRAGGELVVLLWAAATFIVTGFGVKMDWERYFIPCAMCSSVLAGVGLDAAVRTFLGPSPTRDKLAESYSMTKMGPLLGRLAALALGLVCLLLAAYLAAQERGEAHAADRWLVYQGTDTLGWESGVGDDESWFEPRMPFMRSGVGQILVRGEVVASGKGDDTLTISADDCVSGLYVNGRLAYTEPKCDICTHCRGLTVDLGPYLKPGRNRIAARIVNSGGGTTAFLGAMWGRPRSIWRPPYLLAVAVLLIILASVRKGSAKAAYAKAASWIYGRGSRAWPLAVLLFVFCATMLSNLESAHTNNGHTTFNMNIFTGIGRNIVSTGFWGARFGLPTSLNPDGSVREYYINHPPLLGLLVALSFMTAVPLGLSYNSAATLVPTVFSLATLAVLYLLGLRLFGTRVAFASAAVMALTPMFRSYGQLVCHEPPTTFFIVSAVYAYVLWSETGKASYLRLLLALVAGGCFMGWPAYYLPPLISAHLLLFRRGRGAKAAAALLLLGFLCFAAFAAHAYALAGPNAQDSLTHALRFRASLEDSGRANQPSNLDVLLDSMGNVRKGNTPYVYWAAGLFLVRFTWGAWKRRDVLKESYVVLLILVAVTHNLLWPVGVQYHDYWSYYFTPGLSLAAVAGIDMALRGDRESRFFAWTWLAAFWLSNNGDVYR